MESLESKLFSKSWKPVGGLLEVPRLINYEDALEILKEVQQQVSVEPVVKPACEQYQLLIDALVNILNEDGHQWSTRPCPTCRVITAVIGKPFGCDKRRLSKSV